MSFFAKSAVLTFFSANSALMILSRLAMASSSSFEIEKEFLVLLEKFLGDGLDAKSIFNLRECRKIFRVLEQVEKPALRSMATFIFANDVGTAAGGRELGLNANFAVVFFDSSVFHFDVRESPAFFGRRKEGDKSGVFAVALLQMIGNEIADGRAGAFQLGFFREMDNENVELFSFGRSVSAKTLEFFNMVFESIFDVGGVRRLRFRFVNLVKQIDCEFAESPLVKTLRESFRNEFAGLL